MSTVLNGKNWDYTAPELQIIGVQLVNQFSLLAEALVSIPELAEIQVENIGKTPASANFKFSRPTEVNTFLNSYWQKNLKLLHSIVIGYHNFLQWKLSIFRIHSKLW